MSCVASSSPRRCPSRRNDSHKITPSTNNKMFDQITKGGLFLKEGIVYLVSAELRVWMSFRPMSMTEVQGRIPQHVSQTNTLRKIPELIIVLV